MSPPSWFVRKLRIWSRWIRFSRLVAGAEHRDIIKQRLIDCYGVANRFLSQLEVDYFLIYGTLLGQYREGSIIEGDEDVDFASFEEHYQTIKDGAHYLPAGYHLHDTSARHRGPKLYISDPYGWEIDIYFLRESDGALQSTAIESNTIHMAPFPRDLVWPLKQVDFLGQSTWVPNKSEDWLKLSYGYLGADGRFDSKTQLWLPKHSRDPVG